jgi:H+/Cl- antiporter ClcA
MTAPTSWVMREHLDLARYFGKWFLITLPVGAAIGSAVALFLWLMDLATTARWDNPWLLWLLPAAGIPMVVAYERLGGESHRGSNLVLDEIHEPRDGVTWRMAPLVLITTVATHLFGGSAGREGTAVQIGGSLADGFCRVFRLKAQDKIVLLTCGIAAGFGAVFGTPLAGAVFSLEVLAVGRMRYTALVPSLMASIFADRTCVLWGIHHHDYFIATAVGSLRHGSAGFDPALWLKVLLAALAFGLIGRLFSEALCTLGAVFTHCIKTYWMRPVVGGLLLIVLTYVLGTSDYLGIGVTTETGAGVSIANAFSAGGATPWSWFLKLSFTVITLAAGFKGGEVTPLFFIGATSGNAIAVALHAPIDLFAALGFVAVFASAANTPLACTIMAIELFGGDYTIFFALACFVAYLFSGHSGIYLSQRMDCGKGNHATYPEGATLRSTRESGPRLLNAVGSIWSSMAARQDAPRREAGTSKPTPFSRDRRRGK